MAEYILSGHARAEAARRDIPAETVLRVAASPQQVVEGYGGLRVHQSQVEFADGRLYLVRVVVNDAVDPGRIVTVYRTSKVEKYWRSP